ncbi:hypothetical protein BGZ76_009206, partial [Entomortierella beljakovae]
MDEAGLYYYMSPDYIISRQQVKTCLTIALTANADGSEKLKPFFIGHANKPRCFKKKTGTEYGYHYRHNDKAG